MNSQRLPELRGGPDGPARGTGAVTGAVTPGGVSGSVVWTPLSLTEGVQSVPSHHRYWWRPLGSVCHEPLTEASFREPVGGLTLQRPAHRRGTTGGHAILARRLSIHVAARCHDSVTSARMAEA